MNLTVLKNSRTSYKGKITRLVNWINVNVDTVLDVNVLEVNEESLRYLFQKYDSIQDEIENDLIQLNEKDSEVIIKSLIKKLT